MKNFVFKILDVIGAGFMYLAGGVVALVATIFVGFSVLLHFAVPIFCVIAAWGILKYFGVL